MTLIYKIASKSAWDAAERAGQFEGAPVDRADGFIHLSTAAQAAETARKHFAGQTDLVLVAVDPQALGSALRYEISRGGDRFPHLYGPLPASAVRSVAPVGLDGDGLPLLPLPEHRPGDPASRGWCIGGGETGFIASVGPIWARPEAEGRAFGFEAGARHLNRNGVVHGGALMAFADEAAGRTSTLATGARRQATIQLDVHFVSPARDGDFVEARCRVVRQTRSVNFLAATLTVGDSIVATASGVWKLAEPRA